MSGLASGLAKYPQIFETYPGERCLVTRCAGLEGGKLPLTVYDDALSDDEARVLTAQQRAERSDTLGGTTATGDTESRDARRARCARADAGTG